MVSMICKVSKVLKKQGLLSVKYYVGTVTGITSCFNIAIVSMIYYNVKMNELSRLNGCMLHYTWR